MGAGTPVGEWMATGRLVGVDQARVRELVEVPEQEVVVLTIGDSVARAEIPALCARLRALLESGAAETVVCDVGGLARVDLAAVDALARLRLVAKRHGRRFRARNASAELQALLAFLGLSEAVPLEPTSALEPQGQAEERKQPRRVEEEGDSSEPLA